MSARPRAVISDTFAYLSVLLSIILGLAIAEILQGYGALLVSRLRVRLHAPPLIWSATMLLMATQFWWASFGLAQRENWDFPAFCAVLLQKVVLYMGASVVLPKGGGDAPIDLREHYYREIGPFFGFGLLFIAVGFVKDALLGRTMQTQGNALFLLGFAAVTLLGLFVRRPRLQEVIAPSMAVAISLYFVSLFARLHDA